jgi:hypothetical protein
MTNQLLLDIGKPNPIVLHARNMPNSVAILITTQLREGNFNTTTAHDEFLLSCTGKSHFSLRQKQYIYNLGRKFRLI